MPTRCPATARWVMPALVALLASACDDEPGAGALDLAPTDAVVADDAAADAAVADADVVEPDARPADPDAALDPDRPPIFHAGCPTPGRAFVRQLAHPEARLEGPDALGGPGDWLLASSRAAFVISGDGPQRTYFYYPGVPVDAVALDGCQQVGPERFEEVGWLVARARLDRFTHSTLRAFRGLEWQIVDDGRDSGEARLRVTGVDDVQWLVENELLRSAYRAGDPRAPSTAQGIELVIDYVLPADSAVLRIEYGIHNPGADGIFLSTLAMAQFGDTAPATSFVDTRINAEGIGVSRGLPWVVSRADDGAWAMAMLGRSLSRATISGVDALFDFAELLASPYIAPGQTVTTTWLLATGTDVDDVARSLFEVNPTAFRNREVGLGELEGRIVDEATGAAVGDAVVTVELLDREDRWSPITELRAGADGGFSGIVPDTDGAPMRLTAVAPGRAPVRLEAMPGDPAAIELALGPPGRLVHLITDPDGNPQPGRVELWQGDRRTHRFAGRAVEQAVPVEPGTYDAVVTRGFEFSRHVAVVEIPPGGEARLVAPLERVVDTTGWLATDSHAHASPSSDSDIALDERIAHAAGVGIELAIGTDHEIVSDWRLGVEQSGLGAFISAVGGQEVTATMPEHINAFPITALAPDMASRGGPIVWYGMDLDNVYRAIRDRGSPIVQLNHPRGGCNYMCLVDYDRTTGVPRLDDPTLLGLAADASLWSWDFDAFEVMNGNQAPFIDPNDPRSSGTWEDWQSFLNLGHRVTAMGVSDVHGLDQGSPITLFAAPTDDPAAATGAMLADAVAGGRAIVTAGAVIDASVDGVGPGGDVQPGGPVELSLRVQALPEIDVRTVVVYGNCDQLVALEAADAGPIWYEGTVELDLERDTHLTVAAFGRDAMPRGFQNYDARRVPRGLTNAIYVDVDGNGRFDHPGGKACTYDVPAMR